MHVVAGLHKEKELDVFFFRSILGKSLLILEDINSSLLALDVTFFQTSIYSAAYYDIFV